MKIEKIEEGTLFVSGHDLIDGTPVVDIKPYIPDYDVPRVIPDSAEDDSIRVPEWINKNDQNLRVLFTNRAREDLAKFGSEFPLCDLNSIAELKKAIEDILEADPRSIYRREKKEDQLYYFNVDKAHCTAWFDGDKAEVLRIKPA